MISNFPSINRDISILINKSYSYVDIENLISLNGGKHLQSINLFDVYTDKKISSDKHSLLFSLKFGSNERTLKDKEVDKVINHILNSLKDKFKVIQR